jgi:hypothetical protein
LEVLVLSRDRIKKDVKLLIHNKATAMLPQIGNKGMRRNTF